jgi:RNA polymerase sigma-70 factor (ECF subfamily)
VSADAAGAAVDRAYRVHRATVLATLIHHTRDFELAEEALQDAFLGAIADWRRHGVPANTGAWLTVAARRRAIDRIRRGRANTARAERLAELLRLDDAEHGFEADEHGAVADDRLRLIFTCCHPALDMPARVALTLRALGGLTTAEIAKAFLVAEPTMAKRIVRAKRKIADARIPYAIPSGEDLPARLSGVRQVVYLVYSEGYSASGGADLIRPDLCAEAIRLGRLLCKLLPADAEVWGLLALMLLNDARREARTDADGQYVALASQNRRLWNLTAIAEASQALSRAAALESPGRFQIHAAIAALHVSAGDGADIDWASIAELYGTLADFDPSPAVEVNRATAVAYATTPEAGLEILSPLLADPALASYQPLAASHAELLRRRGDISGAADAYRLAIELTHNDVERRELGRRLGELSDLPSAGRAAPSG